MFREMIALLLLPSLLTPASAEVDVIFAAGLEFCAERRPYFADRDGDGFGSARVHWCVPPPGWVSQGNDCDDANVNRNPGQTEICNTIDDDCDAQIDEDALEALPYFRDQDGDTFGNPNQMVLLCAPTSGFSQVSLDCNDQDGDIRPGASETCNGVDQNCDGEIDDFFPQQGFCADRDGDTFGAPVIVQACLAPPNHIPSSGGLCTDCDDNRAAIRPNAIEVCNGIDDDCDNTIDDGLPQANLFADADHDLFGGALAANPPACAVYDGASEDSSDCADLDNSIYPGAFDGCDGGAPIDQDCDTQFEEDELGQPCTVGLGICRNTGVLIAGMDNACACSASVGNPANEICDGRDNDCNGTVDDGCPYH